jgi:phosphopantetheinyl transferase
VAIRYSQNGKPFLDSEIKFNITHKEQLALVAITRNEEIGVDLEYKRPLNDLATFCERFLSSIECDQIFALPPEQQLSRFYEIWVKKEAYCKAIGGQLFQVLADLRRETSRQEEYRQLVHPPQWLDDCYVYTVASKSDPKNIRYWRFNKMSSSECYLGLSRA